MKIGGNASVRCGSLAISGLPLAVLAPLTANSLLPPRPRRGCSDGAMNGLLAICARYFLRERQARSNRSQLCRTNDAIVRATADPLGDESGNGDVIVRRREAVRVEEEQRVRHRPSRRRRPAVRAEVDRVLDIQIERKLERESLADGDRIDRRPRLGAREHQRAVFGRQRIGLQPEVHAVGKALQPALACRRRARDQVAHAARPRPSVRTCTSFGERGLCRPVRRACRRRRGGRNPSRRSAPWLARSLAGRRRRSAWRRVIVGVPSAS